LAPAAICGFRKASGRKEVSCDRDPRDDGPTFR
jgi:hypothetical protein